MCIWLVRCTQGGPNKLDHFSEFITPAYDEISALEVLCLCAIYIYVDIYIDIDIGMHSMYQHVQCFIRGKNGILNVAMFKYSLHNLRETILHCVQKKETKMFLTYKTPVILMKFGTPFPE